MKYNSFLTLRGNLIQLLEVNNTFAERDVFQFVSRLKDGLHTVTSERDELLTSCINKTLQKIPRGQARADVQSLRIEDIPNVVASSFVLREELVKVTSERDDALQRVTAAQQKLNALYDQKPQLSEERCVLSSIDVLIKSHATMEGTINGLKQLVELPESAGLTELSEAIDTVIYERNLYRDKPDTTQPQLSEIRYVLHGDIQPCSVLYSDDTTTLLRLDEGDIMCETDMIEWSDSVTYRCQELLREAGVRSLAHVAPRLAQLVRDERILLNDNGGDATETIGKLFVKALIPTHDTERDVASRKWTDKLSEHLASQPKQER